MNEPPRSLRATDDAGNQWVERLISEVQKLVGGKRTDDRISTPSVDLEFTLLPEGAIVGFAKPGTDMLQPIREPLELNWQGLHPDAAAMLVAEAVGIFPNTA